MHASVKVNPATNEIRRRNSRRPLVKLPSIEPQRSPQRTASMKLRHRFNYSPRSSKAPLTSAEIVFASGAAARKTLRREVVARRKMQLPICASNASFNSIAFTYQRISSLQSAF
jgi:hypothetical protein